MQRLTLCALPAGAAAAEPEADHRLLLRLLDVRHVGGVPRPDAARPRLPDGVRHAADLVGLLRAAALLAHRLHARRIHVQTVSTSCFYARSIRHRCTTTPDPLRVAQQVRERSDHF